MLRRPEGRGAEVYVPLSRLISLYAVGARRLHDATREFLGEPVPRFEAALKEAYAAEKRTVERLGLARQ